MDNEALDLSLEGSLPFDGPKQLAFLGHVMDLGDDKLFFQVKDRIQPSWFLDPWAGCLYDAYAKFFKKWNRIPFSIEEFTGDEEIRSLDNAKKLKVINTEILCRSEREKYGKDTLVGDLTDWMRCRIYHHSVAESARLFNSKQLNKAVSILDKTVKEFQSVRFDGEPPATWDIHSIIRSQEADYEGALTTGCRTFDRHLNPDAAGGALLKGDTTVFLAPTNIGKSATLITIARHNIVKKQKSVLFISREGRVLDTQEKILQCFMYKNKMEFRKWGFSEDREEQERRKKIESTIGKFLTLLHMTKPELTVEEVISVIRYHQDRRKAEYGVGYDLLVMDYPAILTSSTLKSSSFEYRQVQDHIYRQFVQLALEEKFHALLACQTNREGSRVNRGNGNREGSSGRLVTLEDVAESYAITHSATNLITINRDPEAQRLNRVTFYICKSRTSDTGWAVCCRSDFGRATSHGDGEKFGAIAYHSSDPMSDRVDKWLVDKCGQDIGPEYMH